MDPDPWRRRLDLDYRQVWARASCGWTARLELSGNFDTRWISSLGDLGTEGIAVVKILHCADVHLDSPLRGLSTAGDAPVDELRGATREAMENLVDLATSEGVGAVVIAGDLYDSDRDDFNTAIFLHKQYARLIDSGIPVVVIHGNHDAASEITRRLRPPQGVHVLSHDWPETVRFEDVGLAFHGQSYATRAVVANLSADYPDPTPGLANVGVLHTALDGRPGHDPYAPCTAAGLAARGYSYWALGHVHQREVIDIDGVPVVFPGNVQGRHAREDGPKGATLVTFEDELVVGLEHRDLDVVRWLRVPVDVSGVDSLEEVCIRIGETVRAAAEVEGMLCAVRVMLEGTTSVADRLVADLDSWQTQVRADLAGATGRLWLEKVDLHTTRPGRGPASSGEAVAAVQAAVTQLGSDPDALAGLAKILEPLRSKLGAEATTLKEIGATELTAYGVMGLLDDVEALLLAEFGDG